MTKNLIAYEYLRYLSGIEKSKFAFKKYLDKDRILFEILLNKDAKLVVKLTENNFEDLVVYREVLLSELGLFASNMIVGKITVREVMRDAKPVMPELKSFFEQNKNSVYSNKPELYPLGIAGGNIEIFRDSQELKYKLTDLAKKMDGVYRVCSRNEKLSMKKV